ncbi:ABC transporter permease [Oribacterium sinus]|jgi:ABC superfamily ATP binding cassette transporter, membrane protein|uniref:Branched-chain amino acid ABC transporter, permease protein n=1 Tax=Oribacterium sinus F0268 TaxID=585501 RepID=C2KVC3_9FIRM|nr:ABC transporter permease [Oribacterium sinus]EEJ52283.1 branched-chain amino acid ABC transporter, permease protein [Oribacterium sinus F0268]
MSGFLTVGIMKTAVELGLIYALVAMALFISYSILNIADLSTDGSYTLGTAVSAVFTISGHPILGIFMAMLSGSLSGFVTAFLQTTLGIESILAGIIVNTGLYTVNLAVMGFSSNLSIFGTDTIFTLFAGDNPFLNEWGVVILLSIIVLLLCFFLKWFFKTGLGLSIRATGDSPAMVRASSINPTFTITVGLCLSNALTGLSGSLIAQYNKTADINLGTGMVTVALASLVIGESIFGKKKLILRLLGVVFGSLLYRSIIALALRLKVPTEAFKLVSACIVALAISSTKVKELLQYSRLRRNAMERQKQEGEKHA